VPTKIEETNLAENLTVTKALEVLKDAALDMKAEDIAILDMTGVVDYLDIMCLATGETGLQVRAIADRIMERLREYGIIPDSLQGHREGSWVALDVMLPDLRAFYRLEDLWSEARALHI
jgi:ribosome-associated protein